MTTRERVVILVKAWPQPSLKYGETVCCAGVTLNGQWRRLFPIRFRHLEGPQKFKRWDIIEYLPHTPNDDNRAESRRVEEQSLKRLKSVPKHERASFLEGVIRRSIGEAAERNDSLALIRPDKIEFIAKRKSSEKIESEKAARSKRLLQRSLLDRELIDLEICEFRLSMRFAAGGTNHHMELGDWETAAAFFRFRKEKGEAFALRHLKDTYENTYFNRGLALALGTVKKRPRQWLLLGVIRLDLPTSTFLI